MSRYCHRVARLGCYSHGGYEFWNKKLLSFVPKTWGDNARNKGNSDQWRIQGLKWGAHWHFRGKKSQMSKITLWRSSLDIHVFASIIWSCYLAPKFLTGLVQIPWLVQVRIESPGSYVPKAKPMIVIQGLWNLWHCQTHVYKHVL